MTETEKTLADENKGLEELHEQISTAENDAKDFAEEISKTKEMLEEMDAGVRIEEDSLLQKEMSGLNSRGKRTLKNSAMAALSIAGEAAAAAAGMTEMQKKMHEKSDEHINQVRAEMGKEAITRKELDGNKIRQGLFEIAKKEAVKRIPFAGSAKAGLELFGISLDGADNDDDDLDFEFNETEEIAEPVKVEAPPKQSAEDILSLLQKLSSMKDAGILSEEEFANKKAELLLKL